MAHMQAQLVSFRDALKVTRRQALAVRADAAARSLRIVPFAGEAFESFQAALSEASSTDESSWWSGSSVSASETVGGDSDESADITSNSNSSSSASEASGRSNGTAGSPLAAASSSSSPVGSLSGAAGEISGSARSAADGAAAPASLSQVSGGLYSASSTSTSTSTSSRSSSSRETAGDQGAAGGGAIGGAGGLDASQGVLVTIDVSGGGVMEDELLAAVCMGRISEVADFEVPEGPNMKRNRRLFQQEDLLACLAADNRLYLLKPSYLAAVHWNEPLHDYLVTASTPAPADGLHAIKGGLQEAAVVRWIGGDLGMVCPGTGKTAKIAFNLSKHVPEPSNFLLEGSGWPEAVSQAKEEYKAAKKSTRVIEREVRKAKQLIRSAGRSRRGREGPAEAAMQLKSRAKQLRKKARNMQSSVEWGDVLATVEVLAHVRALQQSDVDKDGAHVGPDAGWFELQNLGLIARDIRFENELWLAMILENPALEGIKPSTLSGLVCALVTPFQVSRPEVVVELDPSDDLQLLVEELSHDAVHLASVQAQKGMMCPIEVDLKMAGLVEAWMWNVAWEDLKEACDLDDGDIARLLCRVADLLRQVSSATAVKDSLRSIARTAYKRIYRQPICDLLGL